MELVGRLSDSFSFRCLMNSHSSHNFINLLGTKHGPDPMLGAKETFVNNNSMDKSINFQRLTECLFNEHLEDRVNFTTPKLNYMWPN